MALSQQDKNRIAQAKALKEKFTRDDLLTILQVAKVGGYANANKTKMINKIIKMNEEGELKYIEAKRAVYEMRQALGLSTNTKVKSDTQGLRKSKKDDKKSAKDLADEALGMVKKALALKGKPKLKKQFLQRIQKEMDDFEDEIKEVTRVPGKTMRAAERVRDKQSRYDSSQLKQDV